MSWTLAAPAATFVCLIATAALVDAERRDSASRRALTKLTASSAFVALASTLGAAGHDYGRAILVALGLSWLGDACLLSLRRAPFLLGIGSFLLAHLAFAFAFLQRPLHPAWLLVALGVALLAGVAMLRWLWPHLERFFRAAVPAYVAALVAMLALGVATRDPLVAAGALAFALSDVSVARDRFVVSGVANRIWGLPLYYVAQLLLAWSVAGAAA
jgi:uncharacterized membrane protein YhhN